MVGRRGFNEILFESKKEGFLITLSQMDNFSLALKDCSLHSLKSKGDPYTQCNRRKIIDMMCAKLDRFFCNEAWHNMFLMSVTENHAFFGSAHRPISVSLQATYINNLARYPKRF